MGVKSLDEIFEATTKKGKKKKAEMVRTLTDEHKKMIQAIVMNKQKMKMDQEAIGEDTKAVAEKLGVKTTVINKIVGLIIQEQEKGGALNDMSHMVDLVQQVMNIQGDEGASTS